jgi:type II secretory pathway pseudopilin PulG
VKAAAKQSNKKGAFTIIELLTVMSIIIILIGLLVPALNMVKRFAKRVMQKNQFHSIEVAMETYNAEWEDYPPSEWQDELFRPYCGAMKLCEAMVGQDLLGFHPNSRFQRNDPAYGRADLSTRRKYLIPGSANAYEVDDLYENWGPFDQNSLVLCDVFPNITPKGTSKLVGMPILYYKADTSKTGHNAEVPPPDSQNIYNYLDNQPLLALGMPWAPPPAPGGEPSHRLYREPSIFYVSTRNDKIDIDGDGFGDRPYNADSYILLSSGWDGEYGTDDDMYNFKR